MDATTGGNDMMVFCNDFLRVALAFLRYND